jgi:hypothetical protein
VQRGQARDIYQLLDQQIPGWRQINTSGPFLDWLNQIEPINNQPRGAMLRAAFNSGDAERVANIFRAYAAAHGGARTTRSTSARSRHHSAPMISSADIERFYADVAKGRYTGREAEKERIEQQIIAAANANRIIR